jgi:MerR family transcriptional regulator, mercuric resistance operon regulatory protein
MGHEPMRTGELAAAAGVNPETLRYYERRGLLEKPRRLHSGYRAYPRSAVEVVRFVKRAQELGFTLDEVQELLRLRKDQSRPCDEVRAAAAEKLAEIDGKLRSLETMKRALSTLIASCVAEASTRECPLLEALNDSAGISS